MNVLILAFTSLHILVHLTLVQIVKLEVEIQKNFKNQVSVSFQKKFNLFTFIQTAT